MKTRFDGNLWVTAFGVAVEVKEMETAHLLNTVKMLVQKPARVQAIGGFPLIWEWLNGKGTCRWASEIEEFPIAITKYHFPEEENT